MLSFEAGGTKLERMLPKNQHTQRKNLRTGVMGRCQKLGIILEKQSDLEIVVIKKCVPKLIFFNEIGHFLTPGYVDF